MFALKTVIFATFLAAALASQVTYSWRVLTSEQFAAQYAANNLLRMSQGSNITYYHRVHTSGSTDGDFVTGPREEGDSLLVREILLIHAVATSLQVIEFAATVPRISAVRILNFGLDRAYTLSHFYNNNTDSTQVVVLLAVDDNLDPRVLAEVYGYS